MQLKADKLDTMGRLDVKKARRGRTLSFWGAWRELRRIGEYLNDDEEVHDLAACAFGNLGGRAVLILTNERVLIYKDGWFRRNAQSMAYSDIKSVEIKTGLFFGSLEFRGEGMAFEAAKIGRFAANHTMKLLRNRIGSRYKGWELQQEAIAQQKLAALQQSLEANTPAPSVSNAPPKPSTPPTTPLWAREEEVGLDAFLPPQKSVQSVSSADLIAEMERLSEQLNTGQITREQYDSSKNALLS